MRVFFPTLLLLCTAVFGQSKPVTTNEILELLKAGVSESVIIDKINADGCDCDTSAFGIMILKGADASDELVRAVINAPNNAAKPTTRRASVAARAPTRSSSFEPRGFVFGGFSYARDTETAVELNWYGGHGQVGVYVTDWLAVAGDVSYHRANLDALGVNLADLNLLTFAAGPQFGNRRGKARGFGQVLFGGVRVSGSDAFGGSFLDESTVEFATVVGGGIDVNLTERFSIRAVEADWLRVWKGEGFNWVRLSFGVVGRF